MAVVGAGIVGLATAFRVLERRPGLRVAVLDKEAAVGTHQTGHNSGVMHAGVYYPPGSLKARLTAAGKRALERFAAEHDIPVVHNGKVVVAVDDQELPRLEELHHRARANGVEGLREIGPGELAELEPAVSGIRALHSPRTAVVDFMVVAAALADEVTARGGEVLLRHEVVDLAATDGDVRLVTTGGFVQASVGITCAGLQSDRLAALTGDREGMRIVPFRGSYWELVPEARDLVRGNVYPVPDPRYPFLGVHFTRRVDGSVWAGPNAVLAGAREGYTRGQVDWRDVADWLGFPGFWRLAARNVVAGAREVLYDRVRDAYLKQLQRYVPAITAADLVDGPSGIRAQAVAADGSMVDDFSIGGSGRLVHVRSAPSPAATACLAIGDVLADAVEQRLR